jgi:hypothetical protein
VEDIPVKQIIHVEHPSLAQKVRQLLDSVRSVVEVPPVGRPVRSDRGHLHRGDCEADPKWVNSFGTRSAIGACSESSMRRKTKGSRIN